ncbi:MAG: 2-amino-4-hydroxy-6-hydroxymethyldihydropteridine diphosphokinase [Deltaproteobacteria bacterium]|nr:MAG: 2-amino-4-hydroxy-6-hydroxymethyldihydropteridine diphosphokinase [Deltaproteobacteria bacterium]
MPTPTPRTALVALGSNLGDRRAHLRRALDALPALACGPVSASDAWETAPMYLEEQPPFLNAVCRFATTLPASVLLDALLGLETRLGRRRLQRNGPRAIDLDLLDLGGERVALDGLTLPHPRLHERPFVLVPLLELCPEWTHPELGADPEAMLRALGPLDDPPRRHGSLTSATPSALPGSSR